MQDGDGDGGAVCGGNHPKAIFTQDMYEYEPPRKA
jgi:hypothetical protein